MLPQLEQRLSEGAEVEAWLDEAMASYGRNARRLVAGGIAERFKDGGVSSADLRKLFGLIEV